MTDEEIRQAFDEAMSSIPHGHQVAIARYVVSLKDRIEAAAPVRSEFRPRSR